MFHKTRIKLLARNFRLFNIGFQCKRVDSNREPVNEAYLTGRIADPHSFDPDPDPLF
jgi:hypothetical protein